MESGSNHFFLLVAKFMCAPGAIKAEQNTTSTSHNIPRLGPENIRESILDFTALLGETNPTCPIFADGVCRDPKGLFFLFFPSVWKETIKIAKSSIFGKK